MIANARMYSVSPEAAGLWRELLSALIAAAQLPIAVIEHAEPQPIEDLWRRPDLAGVFMCGLPFSRAAPQPLLVAAPVPSPAPFEGEARYWSDLVVRADGGFRAVSDTFGGRIAFTVPDSQSGCVAALSLFMSADRQPPLFGEIIAPTITPLGALTAVVRGAADIAPIDSYALALMRRYRPGLASQVRVVGRTAATPIPPLVASGEAAGALTAAFLEAHRDAALVRLMDGLLLQRFVAPEPSCYRVLRDRYQAATAHWRSRPLAAVSHPAFAW